MRANRFAVVRLPLLGKLALLTLFVVSADAQAQRPGDTTVLGGFAAGDRFTPQGWLPRASESTLLPSGTFSGFVPYTPGPGQGMGVMSQSRMSSSRGPREGMGMLGERSGIGQIRANLVPLAPIGIMSRPGMGQGGMSGSLIRRMPAGGAMGGMGRPPVGRYPFRIPPSLNGASSSCACDVHVAEQCRLESSDHHQPSIRQSGTISRIFISPIGFPRPP